jgi:uncharacterized membrane protein YhaH (DUF805 family)
VAVIGNRCGVTANLTMKEYLTYAPIIIFLVWIYIVVTSFKTFNVFKKASGKSYISLLNPLNTIKLKEQIKGNKELEEAYISHKRSAKKLFWIWLLTVIIFMIVSAIIGVLTAINS